MKKVRDLSDCDPSGKSHDKYISDTGTKGADLNAISPMEQLRVAAHKGLIQSAQSVLEENERDYRIHQRDLQRRKNLR